MCELALEIGKIQSMRPSRKEAAFRQESTCSAAGRGGRGGESMVEKPYKGGVGMPACLAVADGAEGARRWQLAVENLGPAWSCRPCGAE